jgi:tetratricopeptide (TPR) repeat protein
MKNKSLLSICAVIALCSLSPFWGPVASAKADDQYDCIANSNPDGLAACTRVIQSKGSSSPSLILIYSRRSQTYEMLGMMANAINDAGEAIRLAQLNKAPTFLLLTMRSHLYAESGRYVDSLNDLNQIVALYPAEMWVRIVRARAYTRLGESDKAIDDLSIVLKLNPPDDPSGISMTTEEFHEQALSLRCLFEARMGKRDDLAMSDCNAAVNLVPVGGAAFLSRSNAYLARGYVYLRGGNFSEAIADETMALNVWRGNYMASYVRGLAEAKAGDAKQSAADIAAAKHMSPHVEEEYPNFGLVSSP